MNFDTHLEGLIVKKIETYAIITSTLIPSSTEEIFTSLPIAHKTKSCREIGDWEDKLPFFSNRKI
jgi:hypothetical protein